MDQNDPLRVYCTKNNLKC